MAYLEEIEKVLHRWKVSSEKQPRLDHDRNEHVEKVVRNTRRRGGA